MRMTGSRNHDWLSLVTVSGLVVSDPVLAEAFPEGPEHIPPANHRAFIREWERYQQCLQEQRADAQPRWLRFIAEDLLGLSAEHWLRHPDLPESATCQLVEYKQVLRPSWVLLGPDGEHSLLVSIVPPGQSLDRKEDQSGKWRASPAVKLERLLRETRAQLGLLTNGREFRLMLVPPGLSASHMTFEAGTWADEKPTLDGFFTLMRRERFFGPEDKRLAKLIADSQEKQLQVTDQLGDQVRNALESFVRGLDQADRGTSGELLAEMPHDRIYEMALIVMMRLVFMLYGEENYLLPHGEVLYDQAYGVTHLYSHLADQRRRAPESMHQTFDAWPRLLATFRLVHDGCSHPDLNLIAYGGKLFDPARFSVLEDPRVRIPNECIYQILRSLCFAKGKLGRETVPQRLSYQALDIEQIGTVYEGLIDYTVQRAPEDDTLLVFKGKGQSLRPLSEVSGRLTDSAYLQEQTGFSASRVQKLLEQQELPEDPPEYLPPEILSHAGFIDAVIPPGHLYVAHQSGLRKGQGTYYTPKWITSFICERTLEPLVFDGKEEARRIRSPEEILALKVCDPAMGSGAFLVQACRYLADRLVDSWDRLAAENPDRTLTMPFGKPVNGGPPDMVIPEDHKEAVIWARRFVAEHCLYGVDLNPLAVELARMSLWLITLSKDKPFEFFDHKLKHGNSLIGCWTSDLQHYPVAAWDRKGAEGPVKEALKQIKKDAKAQAATQARDLRTGTLSLMSLDVDALRAETAAEMREIDEVSTFSPQERERLYQRNIVQDERYQALKRMFDTWCALWFWPLPHPPAPSPEREGENGGEAVLPPLTSGEGDTARQRGGGEVSSDLPLAFAYPELLGHFAGGESLIVTPERLEDWARTVGELRDQERFFHWELEFPDVFEPHPPGPLLLKEKGEQGNAPGSLAFDVPPPPASGEGDTPRERGGGEAKSGFDAVVMNPPWERIKLQENEFFAIRDPEIAHAPNAAARKRLIERLPETNPALWSEFSAEKQKAELESFFVRESGHYPLTGRGDINLYPVFAEHARRIAAATAPHPPAPSPEREGGQGNAAGSLAFDVSPPPASGEGDTPRERGGGEALHRVHQAAARDKITFAREQRQAPTEAESLLWERLRGNALGVKFRRQHPIGDFVLDFYCEPARLAVELDGPVHEGQVEYDQWRDERLRTLGVRTLRLPSEEVLRDVEGAVETIRGRMATAPHPPAPSPEREGETAPHPPGPLLLKEKGEQGNAPGSLAFDVPPPPASGEGDTPRERGGGEALHRPASPERETARPAARVGMVIPSGIATDDTTKFFFQDLMDTRSLCALFDFINSDGAFYGVHRSYKFCLLMLQSAGTGPQEAEFAFFLTNREHLDDPERRFTLSGEDIALLNPNTRTCPIFRTVRDAEITKALYRRHPVLIRELRNERGDVVGEENPWGVSFLRMLDMANDSGLFCTREELEAQGAELREPGNHFVTGEKRWLPLYEGKMFQHYDHRAASVIRNEANLSRPAQPLLTTDAQYSSAGFSPMPEYWVAESDVRQRLADRWKHDWLLAFKDVTSATNERTAIFTVLPMSGVGHKAPLVFPEGCPTQACCFFASAASMCFDYSTRQMLGGVSLTYFVLEQLPIIPPDAYTPEQIEFISSRVLELTYTAWDIRAFAQDMGYDGPPFVWDEERRAQLRAQLDALYFHLYGISRDDADYILSTFPIVRRKDEARYGTYRTRDLILSYYDAYAGGNLSAWFGRDEDREPRVHDALPDG